VFGYFFFFFLEGGTYSALFVMQGLPGKTTVACYWKRC